MLQSLRSLVAATAAFAIASLAHAVKVGDVAPAFTLKDCTGKSVSLADFKGKTVVLEWFNSACPFVVKHYSGGDMQKLQADMKAKGVVWLVINSTSSSHKDYLTPEQQHAKCGEWKLASTATLMDTDGTVGKAYDARVTPHMYVISPDGKVAYNGAIDSIRSTKQEDVAKAENYVVPAVTAVLAGTPVANASTKPYGCSVKY